MIQLKLYPTDTAVHDNVPDILVLNKPNFTEIGCITGTTMVAALDATTLWR
jgi:hypothetical protein